MYGRLKGLGMRSALATYHVKPSWRGGWHYHLHLMVEWKEGVTSDNVLAGVETAWNKALKCLTGMEKPVFVRKVCDAGGPITGMGEQTQMEFWQESGDAVGKALQYIMREILQGVEGWIEKVNTDVLCEEFATALSGAKLHRLYGVWRKKAAGEVAEDGESVDPVVKVQEKAKEKAVTVIWTAIGRMDGVLYLARNRSSVAVEFLGRLLRKSCNRGCVAMRLQILVSELAL